MLKAHEGKIAIFFTLFLSLFLYSPAALLAEAGDEKWYFPIALTYSSPAIGSDGTIYAGSGPNGELYAINPNGNQKWAFATGGYIYSSPAIGSDGTIYVGSYDNNLYAINPDGTRKWAFQTLHAILSPPAIGSDGTIYVVSNDNNLYAINTGGTQKWEFTIATGDFIPSSPAIGSDGTIYVGSYDGKLYAIRDEGTHFTQKWAFATGGVIWSSPAIGSDGTIYVGSDDDKLYAINPDGTQKWTFTTGYDVRCSPAIGSDGTIYVGSWDGNLYAITDEGEQGTRKWAFDTGGSIYSSPAIGSDGTIYVGSFGGSLYAIDSYGTLKWAFDTYLLVVNSSPAIGSDGTIYVGSDLGKLHAIDTGTGAGLADSPWPKFRQDLQNNGCIDPAEAVDIISDYIAEMDAGDFDNAAHQGALLEHLKALAKKIDDLNPKAALARLKDLRKRVEKWVVDEQDQTAVFAMIDRLTALFELQPMPGKGKGKSAVALSAVSLPAQFALFQNDPNPFNPSTTISYAIPEGKSVLTSLEIYNARGQLVKTLVSGMKGPGRYVASWNGRDDHGRAVSSGVYFYRIKAGDFVKTRKMLLLK